MLILEVILDLAAILVLHDSVAAVPMRKVRISLPAPLEKVDLFRRHVLNFVPDEPIDGLRTWRRRETTVKVVKVAEHWVFIGE